MASFKAGGQSILRKQRSRPGHIMQIKRDLSKILTSTRSTSFDITRQSPLKCTLSLSHTHHNSYSAWLKEAMHINEAQVKKPQLGWGQRCSNSPFPSPSVAIYYKESPPHCAAQHVVPHHGNINTIVNTGYSRHQRGQLWICSGVAGHRGSVWTRRSSEEKQRNGDVTGRNRNATTDH